MANPLTPDEVKLAHKLRVEGTSWAIISKTLGRRGNFVRYQLDLEFRERRTLLGRYYAKKIKFLQAGLECPKPHFGARPDKFFIPPEVESDKERRRELQHSTFTAAHCGDPLPGRSALDKRKPKLVVSNPD